MTGSNICLQKKKTAHTHTQTTNERKMFCWQSLTSIRLDLECFSQQTLGK